MTPAGWAIMLVSIGGVLALVAFCLYRVLMLPPHEAEEHLKGPLVIDTGDTEDADRNHSQAHDSAATEGNAKAGIETLLGSSTGSPIRASRDVHAGVASTH